MKKILLILVAVLGFTTMATAQNGFKKSDKFVEGTFSYEKQKDVDATWTFNPSVGYFFTDKFAVGASLETGNVLVKNEVDTEVDSTTPGKQTSVGVFARCYFLNVGKDFKVYSQLGVNNRNLANDDAYLDAGLGLGLNYFVTKNLALTTSLASLVSYNDNTSTFRAGFDGVNNPFNTPKFGLIYKW